MVLCILYFMYLLIYIGCKVSSRCLYYVHISMIYIGYLYWGIAGTIYGLFHEWHETSQFAKVCFDPIGNILNIHYHIEGLNLIDKERAYIVICNHQHALD